jgi:hypothetical protein
MTPVEYSGNRSEPITFSELKKLVNEIDEIRWGTSHVYVGTDGLCPVVELSMTSGLPAAPKGSSAARWYGESAGVPPKILIEFRRP